jgi:hypothetical protein
MVPSLRSEFKRCRACGRPLLGSEAEQYRHLLETGPVREDSAMRPTVLHQIAS